MARITIYQKPTCSTCRDVYRALVDAKVDFEAVDYYVKPMSKRELTDLIRKMGMTPRELLRKNTPLYSYLNLEDPSLSESRIVELMVANPDLIQRPIVEKGDEAILARPASRIKEIL